MPKRNETGSNSDYRVTPGGRGNNAPERSAPPEDPTLTIEAFRRGLRNEAAWERLTPHQRQVVAQFVQHGGNVTWTAESLGVSRTAIHGALRLAGKKFLAFGLVD